jgi:hypothetical protein
MEFSVCDYVYNVRLRECRRTHLLTDNDFVSSAAVCYHRL